MRAALPLRDQARATRVATGTCAASTSTARTAACATSRWSSWRASTSRRCCASGGRCRPPSAFDIAVQVADGLQAIHDAGIVHRDLKTPNIMLDARGVVRLMDFGIAKQRAMRDGAACTVTGQIVGTPEYMSPEQARARQVDNRSDLYSLGVVALRGVHGARAVPRRDAARDVFKHLNEPPAARGAEAALLPPALVPVLRKALAKKREERYANASEMAQALEAARFADSVRDRAGCAHARGAVGSRRDDGVHAAAGDHDASLGRHGPDSHHGRAGGPRTAGSRRDRRRARGPVRRGGSRRAGWPCGRPRPRRWSPRMGRRPSRRREPRRFRRRPRPRHRQPPPPSRRLPSPRLPSRRSRLDLAPVGPIHPRSRRRPRRVGPRPSPRVRVRKPPRSRRASSACWPREEAAFVAQDLDTAIGRYEAALALDPRNAVARMSRAAAVSAKASRAAAPPPAPKAGFVPGRTVAESAETRPDALAGAFEDSPGIAVTRETQAAQMPGRIEFRTDPASVAPAGTTSSRCAS